MSRGHGPPPEQQIARARAPADRRPRRDARGRAPRRAGRWRRAVEGAQVARLQARLRGRPLVVPLPPGRHALRGGFAPTARSRRPPGGCAADASRPCAVKGPVIQPPTSGPGRCPSTSGSAGSPPAASFAALACELAGDGVPPASRAWWRVGAAGAGGAAADHGPRPAGALPATCSGSSSRARRCRPARGASARSRACGGGAVAADLLGRRARGARAHRRHRGCSAPTSAPTPASCSRDRGARLARRAAACSRRSSSARPPPAARPPHGSRWPRRTAPPTRRAAA